MFRHFSVAILFTSLLLVSALAQNPKPQPQGPAPAQSTARPQVMTPAEAQTYVTEQFGPAYRLLPGFPLLVGDLDGDSLEDIALVATAKDPLLDETQYHYKTIDPYNEFFGFGDPQVTMRFTVQDDQPRFLLIVQGWKEATPKAKFVAINLPFEKIQIARVRVKKKTLPSIGIEDSTGATSDIYWTGKQWKWADSSMN
jgi:hypothetical protein